MSEELIEKMNTLMYFLVKGAARDSFVDFLDEMGISMEEYDEIKKEWGKIGIKKPYI